MPAPVIEGAEPFSARGSDRGVLVVHGFTGNPHSMRPVAEALAAAGFSVELPLLPGHGTSVEDMQETSFPDWLGAAEATYADLAGRLPGDAGELLAQSRKAWTDLQAKDLSFEHSSSLALPKLDKGFRVCERLSRLEDYRFFID